MIVFWERGQQVMWVVWQSVYSHLEVSVYYTLLMTILHRWHNLPSDRLMEGGGWEGERGQKTKLAPWKWSEMSLCTRLPITAGSTSMGGQEIIIRPSEPKRCWPYKKSHILSRSDFGDVLSHFADTSPSSVATPPPDTSSLLPSRHVEGTAAKYHFQQVVESKNFCKGL